MPKQTSPSELQHVAAQWVARRNNGELNAEEQRAFLVWLNACAANSEAYAEAEALWEEMRGLDEIASQQLIEARKYLQHHKHPPRRRQLAAIAAMLLMSSGIAWYSDIFSFLGDQTYQTALGERKKFDLADGSQLELNTNSEAFVHYARDMREVRLIRGQAVFTVVHDNHRPFDVLAGGGRIRDIGTQFDVRFLDERVVVAVLDGEVEISAGSKTQGTRLHRGMRLSYTPTSEITTPEAVDINTVSSWREGRLVFHAQPLKKVLDELGRYHQATITVTSQGILETQVSGSFPTNDFPQALRTMSAALPIKLTRTGPQHWQIDRR